MAAVVAGVLPDQFDLPEAFLVGDPVVIELNRTLAGSFGAMSQHVKCVRGRAGREAGARNPASFRNQTRGRVTELRDMTQKALNQSALVVDAGGEPFPFPAELVAAINELFVEYDVEGIPALLGQQAEVLIGED